MRLNMSGWKKWCGLLALLLVCVTSPAEAILKDVGPTDPANGFAVWYRDLTTNVTANGTTYTQGLPLQICLSQTESPLGGAGTYMCNLLPEPATQDLPTDPPVGSIFDPTQPIVFPTQFPSEAFWWSADSAITTTRYNATLVLGLEAAFGAGPVTPGDQVSFGRVRIRVDTPQAGNYRITHPYGVVNFQNVPSGTKAINYTSDIGIGAPGDFTGALNSAIGPFLRWDTEFPVVVGNELFVGDPNVEHTVTGSPFNTNVFRIERLDANDNVVETVESDLFLVTGKIYTTPIPGPLTVKRATYSRNATGAQIDVFATTSAISNVDTPSSLAIRIPNLASVAMRTLNNERHVAHLAANPTAIPTSVRVVNVADVPPTARNRAVTDLVTITQASYNPATQVLTIAATSSDEIEPPVLTTGYGNLVAGQLAVPNVTIPPATVQVVSSAGGMDLANVAIVTAPGAVDGSVSPFAPNGGEVLTSGSVVTTTWPAVKGATGYRLQYSTNNGTTWQLVANVGVVTSYNWTVPTVVAPAPNSLFRAVAIGAIGVSRSKGVFTITPTP